MPKTITVHHPKTGAEVQVAASSLATWQSRGWVEGPVPETPTKTKKEPKEPEPDSGDE